MLKIKIIETGKIETLSVYGKNGIDWATDFISDGGNQHDDSGNTIMTQADYDWWSDACDKQQDIDDYLDGLHGQEHDDLEQDILDAIDSYNDMEDQLNITLDIIRDHRLRQLSGSSWGELSGDQRDELLKLAIPTSGIDGSTVLAGPCIVDFLPRLSIGGFVSGGDIIIADDAILYDPIA